MGRNSFWKFLFIVLAVSFLIKRIIFPSLGTILIIYIIYRIVTKHKDSRYRDRYENYDYRDDRGRDYNDNYEKNYSNSYNHGSYGSYKKDIIFSHSEIVANGSEQKYNIVFSDGHIDLTRLPVPVDIRDIKISVVFSNGIIRINEDIPAVISVKSSFSSTRLPDNSNITFGENTYVTRSFREGSPHFYIMIDSVFSNTEVIGFDRRQ